MAADLNLVFDNARQYNADDSLLYQVMLRIKTSSLYLPIHYFIRAIPVKIVREGWNADLFSWFSGSQRIFFFLQIGGLKLTQIILPGTALTSCLGPGGGGGGWRGSPFGEKI